MEGDVGELDTGWGRRRIERGFVAREAVRIGVDDAGRNSVGMERSPTHARRAYFREGRSRGKRRRSRPKKTIDAEIFAPRLRRAPKGPADEDCVVACRVDEKLTLDSQRAIEGQRSD